MAGIRVIVRAKTALHLPFMFFFSVLLLFLSNSMCFSLCSVVHFFPDPFVFLFLHFLLLSITVGFSFLACRNGSTIGATVNDATTTSSTETCWQVVLRRGVEMATSRDMVRSLFA